MTQTTDSGGGASARSRRTQQERAVQAEQALLDAAASLFAQRGVDQTSLGDVGEVAGYSRGLAYHHFGSKAALVDQLARRMRAQFFVDVECFLHIDGAETDVVGALTDMVEEYIATIARNVESSRAFFAVWSAAIPSDAALRTAFANDDAKFRTAIESALRAGQAHGCVEGNVDPAATAVVVVGLLRGITAQYLMCSEAVDLSAAVRTVQWFLRRCLTPTCLPPN
ncbi:TetR family transcriptional regulator [Nocardia elegans]|uniref:TetR/AcrR family transcriptional regulator n=1 Tax=Nocardia elegans TaxID=300029 RepID=UPI00189415B7|nr:TetR family transcriptional regulator [Nocardia elegans]MBF6451167.1 TetR family transcriptional regulator [Nocardia elegans]